MLFHISQEFKGNFIYSMTQNIDHNYCKLANCFLIGTTSNECCSLLTKLKIHFQS